MKRNFRAKAKSIESLVQVNGSLCLAGAKGKESEASESREKGIAWTYGMLSLEGENIVSTL